MTVYRLFFLVTGLLFSFNATAAGGGGVPTNYVSISPAFVVNVTDGHRVRHMQVKAQLKLSSPDMASYIEQHKPAIQHEMVMLLSGKSAAELRTLQGKEKLRKDALTSLQKLMAENTGQKIVEAVYFTEFIIQ
jgi:flagellar FliL protein